MDVKKNKRTIRKQSKKNSPPGLEPRSPGTKGQITTNELC